MSSQTGVSGSSASQGLMSSIGSQVGAGQGIIGIQQSDLAADSTRLASNLKQDLSFLSSTFDLGGNIGAASQSIANRQAADQAAAAKQAGLVGGISSGASVGASFGPGGVVAGGIIGGIISLL